MAKRFSVPEQQSQAFPDYEIEQELEHSQVAGMDFDPKTGNEIYYVPDDDEEVVNDKFKKFRQHSKKAKALSYDDDDDVDDSQSNEDCKVVTAPANDNASKAAATRPKNLKVTYVPMSQMSDSSPKNAKAQPTGPPKVVSVKQNAKNAPTTPQPPASPTPSEAPSEYPEHLPDLSVPAPSYTTKKTVITEDETTSSVQDIGGERRATVKRRSDQQVLESGKLTMFAYFYCHGYQSVARATVRCFHVRVCNHVIYTF